MKVKIESNVPLPEPGHSQNLKQLKVGQSFTFPIDRRPTISAYAQTLKKHKTCKDWRFTVRKISELECRVWRIT